MKSKTKKYTNNIILTLSYLEAIKPSYTKKGFPVPKWIQFAETMIKDGWKVKLHRSVTTVSKYIYISKNNQKFKIRFSNHKANKHSENNEDSDYYVGVGNKGIINTEKVIELIKNN